MGGPVAGLGAGLWARLAPRAAPYAPRRPPGAVPRASGAAGPQCSVCSSRAAPPGVGSERGTGQGPEPPPGPGSAPGAVPARGEAESALGLLPPKGKLRQEPLRDGGPRRLLPKVKFPRGGHRSGSLPFVLFRFSVPRLRFSPNPKRLMTVRGKGVGVVTSPSPPWV